jgi:cysteine desulfurase / selenocysteine lyase
VTGWGSPSRSSAPIPPGTLDLDQLDRALCSPAGLVTLTHVPTQSGLVNPVQAAGERIADSGVPFFLDACQSIGQLPVDVRAIGCDVLTGTGRKWLRGPRGTGLLYVRQPFIERLVPPGVDSSSARWASAEHVELAPDAARFGEFEHSYAAVLGLGAAVDQLLELGVDAVHARISGLAGHLRDALAAHPDVTMTDGDGARSGIVTFTMSDRSPGELVAEAASRGINIGASSAAFARLDMDERGLAGVVRVSPHVYNTTGELDRLIELI